MDLAARPARTGVTHLPEIVFQPRLENPILRNSLRQPQVVRLSIARYAAFAGENRYIQFVLLNPKPLLRRNQLPCIRNGFFLEVIAERKISQHLEKRVMPVGEPDILQIIVLPARPHTLLRGSRPAVVALLQAKKDVLELIHPCIREQQRRVVMWHKRRRMCLAVPLRDEEIQKFPANLRASQHWKLNSKRLQSIESLNHRGIESLKT